VPDVWRVHPPPRSHSLPPPPAPHAPPRGRAAPHRRLGRTDRPRRTARVGRTDREGRTYREGRAAAAPTTGPTRQAAARERAAAPTECRALRETGPRWGGRGAHPRRPPTRRSPRAARGSVRLRPYIYSALGEKSSSSLQESAPIGRMSE